MSQNEAIELLDKYLKGACSEEEKQRVRLWLERQYRGDDEWTKLSEEKRRSYISTLYEDIQKHTVMHSSKGNRSFRKAGYWAAAAILFLAATLGTLYMTVFNEKRSPQVISIQDYATTTTGIGEMKELTLTDGTKVWLNAMSELKYPPAFNGNTREVYIKGEAFFDVAQDEQQPFIVHSGDLETKVLGTSFNVKAYSDNETIGIAVLEGKIAVSRQEAGSSSSTTLTNQGRQGAVELIKNERVEYAKQEATLTKSKITAADYLAWREGKMRFYHTPMKEVARVLHRNYGVDIQFKNEAIQKLELSGQFDKKEDIESVLKAVCLSIEGQYKKNGELIKIAKMK